MAIELTGPLSGDTSYATDTSLTKSAKQTKALEWFNTFLFIKNADTKRYASLSKDIKSQYTRGTQQYSSTIEEAARILSRHVPDNGQKRQGKGNNDEDSKDKDKSDGKATAFAQTDEVICYACGTKGHKSNECKLAEKIPREQWWDRTKKATANVNTETLSSDSSVTVSLEDKLNDVLSVSEMKQLKEKGYCGVQVNMYQSGEGTSFKVVLLDNESSVSIFCDASLVRDVRPANKTLHLKTNGGILIVNRMATLPYYGEVWFDERAIANILSFHEARKKKWITHNEFKDEFIVHGKLFVDKDIAFIPKDGIY